MTTATDTSPVDIGEALRQAELPSLQPLDEKTRLPFTFDQIRALVFQGSGIPGIRMDSRHDLALIFQLCADPSTGFLQSGNELLKLMDVIRDTFEPLFAEQYIYALIRLAANRSQELLFDFPPFTDDYAMMLDEDARRDHDKTRHMFLYHWLACQEDEQYMLITIWGTPLREVVKSAVIWLTTTVSGDLGLSLSWPS